MRLLLQTLVNKDTHYRGENKTGQGWGRVSYGCVSIQSFSIPFQVLLHRPAFCGDLNGKAQEREPLLPLIRGLCSLLSSRSQSWKKRSKINLCATLTSLHRFQNMRRYHLPLARAGKDCEKWDFLRQMNPYNKVNVQSLQRGLLGKQLRVLEKRYKSDGHLIPLLIWS